MYAFTEHACFRPPDTGCHVETFAKVLPAWKFQPTEVSWDTPRALTLFPSR